MQHLDEGTIHAWLDGALPADEAARIETHIEDCADCAERVAEARGLIAAAARIASALDVTPSGVIPAFGARKKSVRRWWMGSAVAATLVVAVGTMLVRNGRIETAANKPVSDSGANVAVPSANDVVKAGVAESAAVSPQVHRIAAERPSLRRGTTAAKRSVEPKQVIAGTTPSPISPAAAEVRAPVTQPSADTIVARRDREFRRAVAGGVARTVPESKSAAATGAVPSGGFGPPMRAARPSAAPQPQTVAAAADLAMRDRFVTCYEVNESTDVVPRRFALVMPGDVRYVDSTGGVDGKIPDVSWTQADNRITIRAMTRGEVLMIDKAGEAMTARSPLGLRTVRAMACRQD
jgi:hypothetical protein